jgi:D-alanine-D-alanine ligase
MVSSKNIYDDAYDEAFQHLTALQGAGFDAALIEWKKDPKETLKDLLSPKIDIVFNASSLRELAFLQAFNMPFVGSGLDLVATSKAARKKVVAFHRLPTPKFFVVKSPDQIPEHSLRYPLFVKPVKGRGSGGISEENVIKEPAALPKVIDKITQQIGQAALVEEFIQGREITVGIIGNEDPTILPLLEIEYSSAITNTYEHKMLGNEIIHCPADFSETEEKRIRDTARRIYQVLNARDFGRVDMIVAPDGTPFFLEINTFAGLTMSSDTAHKGYMGYMAEAKGMSASEFIGSIVRYALERYRIKPTQALTS